MRVKDYECFANGCSHSASSWYKGKPYCNKHWLRLYNNGTLKIVGKRIKTKFINKEGYGLGITSNGIKFKFSLSDWQQVAERSWSLSKTGYMVSRISGRVVKLHRYLLNPEGDKVVDHINGDRLDNRRENLRVVSQHANAMNHSVSKNNKLGELGVSLTPQGKFRARIMVNRKEIRLGNFDTVEEAKTARKEAEKRYFGKYRRKR